LVEEHFEMTMISLLAGLHPERFKSSPDSSICVGAGPGTDDIIF
jgi:hypothetical protein